jgi:CheY-like chemotaxis protein
MDQRPPRILLLDDEADIVEQCAFALKKQYLVVKTNSYFEALSFLDAGRDMIDLVICDYKMPGMNGVEFVDRLRALRIQTPVVLCTGVPLDEIGMKSKKFLKVLQKPFGAEDLRQVVLSSLSSARSESDLYKKFSGGAAAHLRLSLNELEKYLSLNGLPDPAAVGPEEALKLFGQGPSFHVFMAWHHLHSFCVKIPT